MSAYENTVKQIFDLQKFAIKLGLDNIRFLCSVLEDPHKKFPVIHVAGTNGKGSTSFFIAAILHGMGLKTGLFTSPHLVDFRERITIDSKKIDRKFVLSFWTEIKEKVLQRKATFFDVTTAMAFSYFQKHSVDVAIIETGLGGRLDSTNIVDPEIVVITPIDFDHEKHLGNTLTEIASEKAGIIKPGCSVFLAAQPEEVRTELKNRMNLSNTFYYLPETVTLSITEQSLTHISFNLKDQLRKIEYSNIKSLQLGEFQTDNQSLAYIVARHFLEKNHFPFSEKFFRQVLSEKFWPGRLQQIKRNPDVFFDVSHNYAGISRTLNYLHKFIKRNKLHILIGLVEDKDYTKIAHFISQMAVQVVVTEPDTHRKLQADTLAFAFQNSGQMVKIIKDSDKAFEFSLKQLRKGHTLLVIGSHYLIGHLLKSTN